MRLKPLLSIISDAQNRRAMISRRRGTTKVVAILERALARAALRPLADGRYLEIDVVETWDAVAASGASGADLQFVLEAFPQGSYEFGGRNLGRAVNAEGMMEMLRRVMQAERSGLEMPADAAQSFAVHRFLANVLRSDERLAA